MNYDDKRIVNLLKCLSIDMIDVKKYGNPNMCISASSAVYTLFSRYININTNDTTWINRDRFICTSKELSPLIYSNLYMCGYDGITLDRIKKYDFPIVVDTSVSGIDLHPNDLSLATSVGIALSERYLGEKYNQKRRNIADKPIEIFNFYTYVLTTANELMNGISDEAFSFASNQHLGKLIVLYVSSNVVDEEKIESVFNDNVLKKAESLGWHSQQVNNMDDINGISKCIEKAKSILNQPSIIEIKTTQDKYLDNNKIYSSYLTKEEITNFKTRIQVKDYPFTISEEAIDTYRKMIYQRSSKKYSTWASGYNTYLNVDNSMKKAELESLITRGLKYNVIEMYKDKFNSGHKDVLTKTNGDIMQHIVYNMPHMLGGSIGEGIKNHTLLSNQQIMSYENKIGKNILFGKRKNSVGAICNGLALSGLRPFISCKLIEVGFLKPGVKQSAVLHLPTIYIFTYEQIQNSKEEVAVDEIAMLRSIPNLNVFMPCDAKELVGSWDLALKSINAPSAIIVPNEETYMLETTSSTSVYNGAYIVRKESDILDGIIIATGINVHNAMTIANRLKETKNLNIRVVSMPNMGLFDSQTEEYKNMVLPRGVKIMVFETSSKYGLEKYVYNHKYLITLNEYLPGYKRSEYIKNIGLDYQNIETKVYELFK